MTGQEIERKFLVDRLPDGYDQRPSAAIRQGYLAIAAGGNEVRIRSKGARFFLTVKDSGQMTRMEVEIELNLDQFDALWPATQGQRVAKTRYDLPHDGHTIEVDVYDDDLDGLITAEVEFSTEAACHAFQPPNWLGRDVTDDKRYKNRSLATLGRPSD